MNDPSQHKFHEFLEDCYNVQLELEDLIESFEALIYDIELALGELSENHERIHEHLQQVESDFDSLNYLLLQNTNKDSSQELLHI